jgi:hypothetical protein
MICPKCGSGPDGPGKVWLVNADYGYGHGAEYKCYNHNESVDGYRFVVHSKEARADSDAQRANSRSNALAMKAAYEKQKAST